MVALSRFSHAFEVGESVALYHSLRMKPVYISVEVYKELMNFLAAASPTICDVPSMLSEAVNELIKYKILTQSQDEDQKVLSLVQSRMPEPSVNVCYFILSEQCNLACKYCFLGNSNPDKRAKFSVEDMSIETAERALTFFIRQLQNTADSNNKPIIIFYGGEPLLNFPVLEYVAERVKQLANEFEFLKEAELSVITNGILLTNSKLERLKELGVSIAISIDGCSENANSQRVDRDGNPVFRHIINTIEKCKTLSMDISLSITLTEDTIKDKEDILNLVDTYGIKGLGFNILMSDEDYKLSDKYNKDAAQFIIDIFIELRKRGVYEDRMMRKLKAFSKAQVYYSDCAATSGGQIVVVPDGNVGICHGCLSDREYFITSVEDKEFDARINPAFKEWSKLSPVNKEECLSCPALGICGGGCPLNAMHSETGNTIHSIDQRFCVHARSTLDFLIRDLYRIIMVNKDDQ